MVRSAVTGCFFIALIAMTTGPVSAATSKDRDLPPELRERIAELQEMSIAHAECRLKILDEEEVKTYPGGITPEKIKSIAACMRAKGVAEKNMPNWMPGKKPVTEEKTADREDYFYPALPLYGDDDFEAVVIEKNAPLPPDQQAAAAVAPALQEPAQEQAAPAGSSLYVPPERGSYINKNSADGKSGAPLFMPWSR